MLKTRSLGPMLALGAVTALGGCSALGFNRSSSSEYGQAAPAPAVTAPAPMAEQQPPPTPGQTAPHQTAENSAWATVPPAVSSQMIRHVQEQLKHDGSYHGRIDGIWGPQSTQAMRDFQQTHSLHRNGQIDLRTLAAMNLPNGNQQYGQANTAPNGNMHANNGNMNAPNGNMHANNGNMNQVNGQAAANGANQTPNAHPGTNGTQTGANYSTGPQTAPGTANAANLPPPNQPGHNGASTSHQAPPAGQSAPNQTAPNGATPTH